MASAVFVGPNGGDPGPSIVTLRTAFVPTVGDGLWGGQIGRSRILDRTQRGVDVNGSAFAPYSTKGPYYFYPNQSVGSIRGGSVELKRARAVAASNRHKNTGGIGKRTAVGIRYESYAAAKAAHGRTNVDLFGLEQHTHMLNSMIVKAGGSEVDQSASTFLLDDDTSEINAFAQNQPNSEIRIGFYGEEADRARGNNEGTKKLPQRNFFALSQQDLDLIGEGIGKRMILRARAGR